MRIEVELREGLQVGSLTTKNNAQYSLDEGLFSGRGNIDVLLSEVLAWRLKWNVYRR